MKGSKRNRWLKEGYKTSKKWYKKIWNRKVRHSKELGKGNFYKRLAGPSMWDGII